MLKKYYQNLVAAAGGESEGRVGALVAGREHGLANAGGSEGALVAAGGGESEGTEGRSQLPQIAGSCSRPLLRGKVSYRSVALNLFKHISYFTFVLWSPGFYLFSSVFRSRF